MTAEQICAIWETEAVVGKVARDRYVVDSPKAGGIYEVSSEISITLKGLSTDDEKIKLTDWLVEQHEAGVKLPKIDEGVLEHIKTRPKKAMPERIKSFMLFLAKKYEVRGRIETSDKALMAYSSSFEPREMSGCLEHCVSKGYLERIGEKNVTFPSPSYYMEVEGKMYAEEVSKEDKQKRQCFVAMWFDDSMNEVYEKAIKPAIIDAGYDPCRVDEKLDLGKLDDQIIAEIKQSRFMIADFTSEKPNEPRGGVYYEAGFAYGLGLKVIPTCHKDFIEHIHFDTRQLRHIVWDENGLQDFYERIYVSIGANIGWSEDAKGKGASFAGYKP